MFSGLQQNCYKSLKTCLGQYVCIYLFVLSLVICCVKMHLLLRGPGGVQLQRCVYIICVIHMWFQFRYSAFRLIFSPLVRLFEVRLGSVTKVLTTGKQIKADLNLRRRNKSHTIPGRFRTSDDCESQQLWLWFIAMVVGGRYCNCWMLSCGNAWGYTTRSDYKAFISV